MPAVIGITGLKKPDTGLVAALNIGEGGGFEIPRILAVRNQVPKQQLPLFKVKDPQPFLAGWQGEIDNREPLGHLYSIRDSAARRTDGCLENFGIKLWSNCAQAVDKLIIQRIAKR